MEDNNKINLTIENYTGEKPIEVVYREGVAGKVLDQKTPEKIEIAGVLSTPLDWLEKQHDPSGSRAEVYRQTVESNLPKSFTVKIPIFKGPEKTTFDVEFDHYLTDGEVFLQLVSPGAKELTDQYCDKTIDAVLDKIRGVAPDIAIIEA